MKLTKEQRSRIEAEHKVNRDMFDTLAHQLVTTGKHNFQYDKYGRLVLQITDTTQILLDNKGNWSLL